MAKAKKTATKQTKKATKAHTKPRAANYEEKLTINGSFEDLVKELITPNAPTKKK